MHPCTALRKIVGVGTLLFNLLRWPVKFFHGQSMDGVINRRRMVSGSTVGSGEEGETRAQQAERGLLIKQIGASVFFGVSSILIITVNKTVLTSCK